jgi:hypothetical protein
MHPCPHQDGVSPGIVEGGTHRGAPATVAAFVARATGAVVLTFTLPLALTIAFPAVVGNRRGRGRLRTQRFMLRWAQRQLLL